MAIRKYLPCVTHPDGYKWVIDEKKGQLVLEKLKNIKTK